MNEFLWVETYRPKTVADTILPDRIKSQFQAYVDAKNLPNLILSGGPGCGKTTVAKAILDELGCDYMVINGSLNGNIDMLRNEILQFASTVSFNGGRKFVILDEADYLTAATQAALRNFMEEYSKNCGFILTANFRHKIIDALHSRCSLIEFKFRKDEGLELKKSQIKRLATILKKEEIEFDVKALAEVVTKYYPDFRRTINEVQAYSVSGKIDSGILANFDEAALKTLVGFLKDKDFTSARSWAHENTISDDEVFTKLYENSANIVQPSSVPILVKILSDAMYQSAFMSNREINMAAAFVDIMQHVEFK